MSDQLAEAVEQPDNSVAYRESQEFRNLPRDVRRAIKSEADFRRVLEATVVAATSSRGQGRKLVLFLGRGSRGKSFLLRYLVEEAQSAGRDVVVAAGDRNNSSLHRYFNGVQRPTSADQRVVLAWFAEVINALVASPYSMTMDLGGNDLILKEIIHAYPEFVASLEAEGIQVVAIYVLGPDGDDLSYLSDMEAEGFVPDATLICLSEHAVSGNQTVKQAFAPLLRNSILMAAIARGAKVAYLPALRVATKVDDRLLSFAAAEAGAPGRNDDRDKKDDQAPLTFFDRSLVLKTWRKAMAERLATVAGWLP